MLYDKLKKACRDKGASQTALVVGIGMSRGNVTFWKNGQLPFVDVLMKLASSLGVSIDYLSEKEQKKDDTIDNSVAVEKFIALKSRILIFPQNVEKYVDNFLVEN